METSKNYLEFKFHKANRGINENNVLKIMQSIKDFGYIPGRPILVDAEKNIIDGQHRFEACKRLGIAIQYEYVTTNFVQTAIALNSNQQSWKVSDYVESYANQGIDVYRKLLNFEQKYALGLSNSIEVFFDNKLKSRDIKKGEVFDINLQANLVAEFINDCKAVDFYKTTMFVRAIIYMFRKLNQKQLDVIKNNILTIPKSATTEMYLNAFQNLLNRNKRLNNRVYLKP